MPESKRIIAAFDFDETLITRNTLPDFLRSSFPPLDMIGGTLRNVPMLLAFSLKRINNQAAKERLLTVFLSGMSMARFDDLCQTYVKRLNTFADPAALQCVSWHQKQKHEVVIVSASPRDWIAPWAKAHGIRNIIATELEMKDGHLTGKLATPNCHGLEKARRFLTAYPARESYILYMYGDGKSDQAMFDLADHSFVKTFGNS